MLALLFPCLVSGPLSHLDSNFLPTPHYFSYELLLKIVFFFLGTICIYLPFLFYINYEIYMVLVKYLQITNKVEKNQTKQDKAVIL